jgi:transposase-like protein
MSSSQKRYSREFKLEVVRRVQVTGQRQIEVARELGISPNTLSRWMRQFRDEKTEAFPGKGSQTSQAALIARLRRENERLRKERDFLKKTAAYFAATKESDTE